MPGRGSPAALEQRRRNRVVHGWAFRAHTPAETAAIRRFLDTGDAGSLPERYRALARLEGYDPAEPGEAEPGGEAEPRYGRPVWMKPSRRPGTRT